MNTWTKKDFERVRYGIIKLAEEEVKNQELNQTQLQAIFFALAFKAPIEKTKEGWIIQDFM